MGLHLYMRQRGQPPTRHVRAISDASTPAHGSDRKSCVDSANHITQPTSMHTANKEREQSHLEDSVQPHLQDNTTIQHLRSTMHEKSVQMVAC